MRIAFRTDATNQIGTGHSMRCLTMADEFKKQGAQIRFISRNLPVHLSELIITKGFEYVSLSTEASEEPIDELAHANWLGTSQSEDAQATIQAVADQSWDWIVVDHYALDVRWESVVRVSCKKLMVIDDLADRQHDCDVLLDQNYYADMQTRYNGLVPEHCQLLLGPRYALLREEFRILREYVKPRTGDVKRILVFFGGVDTGSYTSLAIQALAELNTALHVDIVIGVQHPKREQMEQACILHGYACHVQTTRMADLMAKADLAIGSGGTAIWERCAMGLPTLSLCMAENQRKQIAHAAKVGLLYAPKSEQNLVAVIRHHVNGLLENPALIWLISNAGMKVVDGKGSLRVAGTMGIRAIEIKRAGKDDSKNIFEWRNNPKIRDVSRNSVLISWEEHQRWFDAVLADTNRVFVIGTSGNEMVGVVRFEIENDVAEVSIYLVPEGGFSGHGRNLLLSAEQWLKSNRSEIKMINASVLGKNEASKNLFLNSNYHIDTICYQKIIEIKND
ncbi:MAG: UDP-2,4-diacetamido-2,4,6-trideoxy-beta-L-altropyranose hydrolase [Candidatus Marinimicrobia bacterium]|nr:UDP-2,4-diacetamido-2,4,6-trideoxy-beta-L-altropyranose hydrolase [Candidatus Neomarinimicrobiota bacterium]